jgi:hypothetical protein
VNTSSPVWLPRMPSLSSFCAIEKPFMPFSIEEGGDAARAQLGLGLGVDHQVSASGPLVIHILLPLSR